MSNIVVVRSIGIQGPSGVGGGGGSPSAHATTHKHGGADEVAVATPAANAIPKADGAGKLDAWVTSGGAAGTPSLRTLGTSATDSCAGNDGRLSNARTPTAHTHTASEVSDFAEAVDDRVASLVVAGSNITVTYNDAGNTLTIASTASSGYSVVSIPYAASITPDLTAGNIFAVGTLTGNITINAPTGTLTDGNRITFRLNQDATGGRTITWNSVFRFGIDLASTDLSTSPSVDNRIVFQYNSTSAKWEALGLSRF